MTKTIQSYDGVLFDFDGTLADSYAAIACSVNHVRAQRGMPPMTIDEVKQFVGRGPHYLLTHTVPGGALEDNLACYRVHHPEVMLKMTELLPGAAALIRLLHERGKKIGLCSNKPSGFSRQLLAHFSLANCFDVVLGSDDVPNPKPAPDMVLRAIDKLMMTKSRVIYIGDMVVDIQTARAAGVGVWAVSTGSESRHALVDAKPDRLLGSLQELVAEIGPV
ncbi:MAG: HAD family hydrolase [Planctomycetes bacterium]|nr:HAD family hydrolase [Planctomycetota bacterium]